MAGPILTAALKRVLREENTPLVVVFRIMVRRIIFLNE
jgi:hypothetical protein